MNEIKVFISYSHDSQEHRERVLNLAWALRKNGIDVDLDQFHNEEIIDWPRWCGERLSREHSDFIVCVCTAEYKCRIEGNVLPEKGKGVNWEGSLLDDDLYDDKGNRRIIPILFDSEAESSIPRFLRGWTYCRTSKFDLSDEGYKHLLRILTRQATVEKNPLGTVPELPTSHAPTNEKNPLSVELLDDQKLVGVEPSRTAAGDIRRPDGTWFIEREAEREVVKHLRKLRITVALRGGRQLGKTEIARRVEQQMSSEGWKPVYIDLRDEFADVDYTTGHGFLRRLAEKIADRTNSDHKMLTVFDQDGTPTAFKSYVDTLKDSRPNYRMLLRLDRVDALAEQPCCSIVLKGLRVLHNAQRDLGEKAWLQVLLINTITPRPTGDSLESIFDVAKVVEVTDFSRKELQKLAALYELVDVDISKLHSFLGGHPALSQLAFEAMRDDHQTLDQIIADSKTGGIFKQYLDQRTKEFCVLPNAKQLANSFRGLVQGNHFDSKETFDALLALGVIKGTYSGDAEVRCELYEYWLPPRIPK